VLRSARQTGDFKVTVVTGASALGFVTDFLDALGVKTGTRITAVAVENRLFGKSVTVSGLVSGRDIVAALDGLDIGRALLVPNVMLKEGEEVFLDDVALAELGEKLGCSVIPFDSTPQGLYRTVRKIAKAEKLRT